VISCSTEIIDTTSSWFDTFTLPQHSSKKFEGSFSYMAPTILNKFLEYLNLPEGQFRTKIEKLCVGYLIDGRIHQRQLTLTVGENTSLL
jgi:hypothetical protein